MRLNIVCAAALLTLVGLVAAAAAGVGAMTGVVIAAAIVTGAGWVRLQGLTAARAHSVVIALAGIAAALLAVRAPGAYLTWTGLVACLGVIAVFLVELVRGTGAARRLESLVASSSGVVLTVLGSGWIGSLRVATDEHAALIGTTAVAAVAAVLMAAVPWPDRVIDPLCVLVATAVAPLVALLLHEPGAAVAAVLGAVAGLVVATFRRMVLADGGPRTRLGAVAAGVGPVIAAGSAVYGVQLLLAG
ncbi:hypothetical protein GCM10011512_11660 [Tersicoccus solisilvae]|uniref:Permease n=1 Tax=Tersicoccus solisilvae TaxID=1882339 RepID=A0ABQ1P035_9MICC|nr:hypothetical protein [Tersicoccus solisilvae]GGC86405.1 hypothetical protein GCM10011512_11660 [Tersicoccus solisilvae]